MLGKLFNDTLPQWWNSTNADLEKGCQEEFYYCYWYWLALCYGVIAIVAAIQLIRIQWRVPDYGWTTQKVFHLMNFIFCVLRCVSFALYTFLNKVEEEDDQKNLHHDFVVKLVVFDLPGLLFFTTYTLLVLFWAEIYHQASNMDTRFLRPCFVQLNVVVYVIEVILWVFTIFEFSHKYARYVSAAFLAVVSVGAVIGFLVYGCRLFTMLRRFPIESRGRKKKLQEVGFITVICSFCFVIRAVLLVLFVFDDEDFDLDLMDNDLLNIVFYFLTEIVAAILVLGILHRLPPKTKSSRAARRGQEYQPIQVAD